MHENAEKGQKVKRRQRRLEANKNQSFMSEIFGRTGDFVKADGRSPSSLSRPLGKGEDLPKISQTTDLVGHIIV